MGPKSHMSPGPGWLGLKALFFTGRSGDDSSLSLLAEMGGGAHGAAGAALKNEVSRGRRFFDSRN